MTEVIEALNEFEVIKRPVEAELQSQKGKYAKLMLALKHLNNQDSIRLPLNYIKGANFQSWLINIKQQCKKKHNIKVGGMLQNGSIVVWSTRG